MTQLSAQHRHFNDLKARLSPRATPKVANHSRVLSKADQHAPVRNRNQSVVFSLPQSQSGGQIIQFLKLVTFCLLLISSLTDPNPPRLQTKAISRSFKEPQPDNILLAVGAVTQASFPLLVVKVGCTLTMSVH